MGRLVVGVLERSLVDRMELEERTGQLLDPGFASLQSVAPEEAFVAAFVGEGIDCKAHFSALMQGILGLLERTSYRIADTVVEELRRRYRSIVVGHTPLAGYCQYRNFQLHRLQPGH